MRERLAVRGIRGDVHDSYRYAASLFSKVVSDGYIGMVRTIPQLYGVIYDRAERASVAGGFRRWAAEFTARNLRPLIEQMQPSAVVCTHAFPCGVMSAYKRLFDAPLPVLGIVTDFVVHPFWIYRNIDAYAVATPEIRAAMIARGIDDARIGVDGIPVDTRFGLLPDDRGALRAELGIPREGAMALVMGGGLGLGPLGKTMRALARAESAPTQVVIVGRNRRLEARLQEEAQREGGGARVLGFVRNVFDWMHAADVLVTKPGGLSTSEALAARVPLVLLPPLPGQEQRNARYLTARGAALLARVPGDLPELVETAIGAGPRAQRLRTAAATLAHPDAAERIAARVARLAVPVSA
ncbi:UDP-glucuronosyltransferase [Vulcanimicrobium alpinum]|uniref:UDP-glucuronosyltransferase n=1 Tax=Vulcanimicrobium alpinum TaxID=3016050 RepID=A0AAN1XVU4_UNVUL|nr:UDP-glucuronosyltransferase [Vulcanimicrobium alpinum]